MHAGRYYADCPQPISVVEQQSSTDGAVLPGAIYFTVRWLDFCLIDRRFDCFRKYHNAYISLADYPNKFVVKCRYSRRYSLTERIMWQSSIQPLLSMPDLMGLFPLLMAAVALGILVFMP